MNGKRTIVACLALTACLACEGSDTAATVTGGAAGASSSASADDSSAPTSTVKLIFIHHSTGENWLGDLQLTDEPGELGRVLAENNYFVSDTNYGWQGGGTDIGDRTDIGHWWDWFLGDDRDAITADLYRESGRSWEFYTRLATDPGGENEVVMFKSCFPNSYLGGSPTDPATTDPNPLRGQDSGSDQHTVANAKGIYNDLLGYFATRQDKLFVAVTAPPQVATDSDASHAANARAFNDWLVNDWLTDYGDQNVAVFDFYNVLTSNGGSRQTSDAGQESGNHHRWWNEAVQHAHTVNNDFSAYGSGDGSDSHPSSAGGQKATAELVPLLNVFYHRFRGE
jgi:hypothetical protein